MTFGVRNLFTEPNSPTNRSWLSTRFAMAWAPLLALVCIPLVLFGLLFLRARAGLQTRANELRILASKVGAQARELVNAREAVVETGREARQRAAEVEQLRNKVTSLSQSLNDIKRERDELRAAMADTEGRVADLSARLSRESERAARLDREAASANAARLELLSKLRAEAGNRPAVVDRLRAPVLLNDVDEPEDLQATAVVRNEGSSCSVVRSTSYSMLISLSPDLAASDTESVVESEITDGKNRADEDVNGNGKYQVDESVETDAESSSAGNNSADDSNAGNTTVKVNNIEDRSKKDSSRNYESKADTRYNVNNVENANDNNSNIDDANADSTAVNAKEADNISSKVDGANNTCAEANIDNKATIDVSNDDNISDDASNTNNISVDEENLHDGNIQAFQTSKFAKKLVSRSQDCIFANNNADLKEPRSEILPGEVCLEKPHDEIPTKGSYSSMPNDGVVSQATHSNNPENDTSIKNVYSNKSYDEYLVREVHPSKPQGECSAADVHSRKPCGEFPANDGCTNRSNDILLSKDAYEAGEQMRLHYVPWQDGLYSPGRGRNNRACLKAALQAASYDVPSGVIVLGSTPRGTEAASKTWRPIDCMQDRGS